MTTRLVLGTGALLCGTLAFLRGWRRAALWFWDYAAAMLGTAALMASLLVGAVIAYLKRARLA